MRLHALCAAAILLMGTAFAGTITPTTTLTAETSNNTSTADTFTTQSNGNLGAGNVSKAATRNLLYNGSTTNIYAHFMGWFGQSNHMDVGYTSSDPTQVHKQVTDALSRGIAGFILDWYGPNNSMPNNTAFALMNEAQQQGGAFVFAVMEDGGALRTCSATAGCDLTQQMISDLTYAWNNFEQSTAYMQTNGRPVVPFFDPDRYGTLDWATIRASVPGNPLFIFRNASGFTHAESDGSFSWVGGNFTTHYPDLSYLDNFYSTSLQYPTEHAFGSAYQGFNDTLASWGQNRIIYQQCGQTWLQTWAEAGKTFNTSTQLENFQAVTWNDYEEGTEFESGIDNCVTVSGNASGTLVNWAITGSETTIDHYTVFISLDGENLMPVSDVPAGTHSLDLAPYNFDPASYTVYVKAVGQPSLSNKMSPGISYGSVPAPAPDFSISATPTSQTATRKGSTSYTVTVSPINGFNSTVNLSVSGLPGNATASFNPPAISGGSGTSILNITLGNGRGSYTLTITGTSGSLGHSTTVVLTVTR